MGFPVTITPDITITPDAAPTSPQAAPSQPASPGVMSVPEGGFRGWLHDLEGDMKFGGERTVVGRMLKKMGAQPLHNGVSEGAADFMGSPVLGTSRATRGGITMTEGAMTHDTDKGIQGGKDFVGGALDASQIPLAFVAPEAGEAGAAVAGEVADRAAGAASKVGGRVSKMAQKVGLAASPETKAAAAAAKAPEVVSAAERTVGEINQSAVPELHGSISNALDAVGANAKNEIAHTLASVGGEMDSKAVTALDSAAKAKTLSEKADIIGQTMRGSAQTIYQQLDKIGGGGRFQRFAETMQSLMDDLKNPALIGDARTAKEAELANTAQKFGEFKAEMAKAGMDQKAISAADKLWSKGASLDEWSRKLLSAEDLSGSLKPGAKPLNNAVRDLTAKASPRGHVLKNGMGEHAESVTGAVQQAADKIAAERQVSATAKKTVRAGARAQQELNKVSRNRKIAATALGGAAAGAYKYGGAAKKLFSDDD